LNAGAGARVDASADASVDASADASADANTGAGVVARTTKTLPIDSAQAVHGVAVA
jgi:hypothetical protein